MARRVFDSWELQLKMGLIHQFTDLYLQDDIDAVHSYEKDSIQKLIDIGGYKKLAATMMVRSARKESYGFIEMHRKINPNGLGRETSWLHLVLLEIAEARQS